MTLEDPSAALEKLMRANDLKPETRLYRATLDEFLTPTEEGGVFEISANASPSEAVVDIYSQGHICLAQQVGPGLAFAESRQHQWCDENRKLLAIELGDVLAQGGRIYPVESVVTERIWYLTIPDGSIRVRG